MIRLGSRAEAGDEAGSGSCGGGLPVVVVVLVPGRAGLLLGVGLGDLGARRGPLVLALTERLGLLLGVGLGDLGVVGGPGGPAEGSFLLALQLFLGPVGVGGLGLGHPWHSNRRAPNGLQRAARPSSERAVRGRT